MQVELTEAELETINEAALSLVEIGEIFRTLLMYVMVQQPLPNDEETVQTLAGLVEHSLYERMTVLNAKVNG